MMREMEVQVEGDVLIKADWLRESQLGKKVRLVLEEGEIRLLPVAKEAEVRLEELAGCLGEERAEEYDFGLKIEGLYEVR